MPCRCAWIVSLALFLASCGPPPGDGTPEAARTAGPLSAEEAARVLSAAPRGLVESRPGLEDEAGWKVQGWGNQATVRQVTGGARRALAVACTAGEKGKVALGLDRRLSPRPGSTARLAVYNASARPVGVALAFGLTGRLVYYESEAGLAKPGWSALRFDLGASAFKTGATSWEHKAALPKPLDVRQVYVLVYSGDAPGTVLLDGLRLDAERGSRAAAGEPRALPGVAAEARAEAAKLPASPRAKVLGLEVNKGWWRADFAGEAQVLPVSAGENMLLLVRIAGEKGAHKVAAGRSWEGRLPGTGSARLAAHASAQVRLGLGLETAAGYFESRPVVVKPGAWRELVFDLGAKTYKSEKSKWKDELAIGKREEVKHVFLVIEGESGARVWLDGVELPAVKAGP